MKKLIPALALLLVSAVMLGTSSFAWFSMNTSVTATGMSVTATAPTSLLISTTSATAGFGSTVALSSDTSVAGSVVPVTDTHSGTTYTFYKLTSAAQATVNENGALTGAAASAEVTENDYYTATSVDYFKDSVWLKLEGATGTKQLKVSAAYTADPDQLVKTAMHILFVNPADGTIALDYDMTNESTASNLAILTAGAAATAYDIYYFLDGADAECKNVNLTANTAMSVTLTFTIVDPA